MSCELKKFDGVTPEVWEKLNEKLNALGFPMPGASGSVQGPMGIVVQYSLDESAGTLSVQVTDKPFIVSCNTVYDRIAGALRDCQ